MEANGRAEEARRWKEAGNDAYREHFLETAVEHYTRGALLDPSDVSFLTNRAAAFLLMGKYEECVMDCNEALERGRELRADNKLIAKALSRRASALLELAGCARDHAPAIRAVQQLLAEYESDEKLNEAGSWRKLLEDQQRLALEAADRHRERGNEYFKKKIYIDAAINYTRALKMNPKDPRGQSSMLHLSGTFASSFKDAEKCVELDPTFLEGYVCKAKVQFLMENYRNALETYLEGLRCDPNNLEVLDGLMRCAACIKNVNRADVELEYFEKMLLHKFQKATEETAMFKKKASDECLRRIESEQMARTREEYFAQELKQIKKLVGEVTQKLVEASDETENVRDELSDIRRQYACLESRHGQLLDEMDRALCEIEELRQKRSQMLSILVKSMRCEFSSSELECATENYSSSLKIGEGQFGCVYRGILGSMAVAIKVLKSESLQGQSQFEQEVAILRRVRHPHLVTLFGACSESFSLVYEFLPNGSLEDFLLCEEKRRTLPWQSRVRIIAEICSALIFLHKNKPQPVVHGDLKPSNILLDANLVSKLSDFGISRSLIQSIDPVGTPVYIDPEFLTTGELTPQSDVYSFGIVVLRMLTGKPPGGIKKIVEDAMEKGDLNSVVDTTAGEWPDVLVQQLAHVAISCTELSPRCRPNLSGEVWTMVETMRDVATLPLASSPRSVLEEISTPSYYICPIFQDVMEDPHFAADGFTYEGEAIRCWLSSGHDTSPMTNLPLDHNQLTPNYTLRSAIQEWLQQQRMASF